MIKGDAIKIVEAVSRAVATAYLYDTASMKHAATHMKATGFADASDQEIIDAFVAFLEARADIKERALREAFAAALKT